MKYKIINKGNYNIYFIKSTKFKTISVSTIVANYYNLDEITESNFISEYLGTANKKYNSELLMSKEFINLYNPRIDIYDIFRDIHAKCFDITFLNEKYTEKGMNKKTLDFYYSLMFNVNEKNKELDKDISNMIIRRLDADYKLREENPGEIAYFDSKRYINADIPFKYNNIGKRKDLKKIDYKLAYKNYINKLKTGEFAVFVIGDLDEDEVSDLIGSNLDKKVNNNKIDYKRVFDVTETVKYKDIKKKSRFNQSIIYFYYKLLNLTERERFVVLPIFNEILGGDSSKLFENVREKNSLAYYAYSGVILNQSILYMYAGINRNNYAKAIEIMKKQIEEMKNGNISNKEFEGAKNELFNALDQMDDKPLSMLNSLKAVVLYDRDEYDILRKKYDSVTKEEVVNLTNKLNLDVLYFLEGEKENENN